MSLSNYYSKKTLQITVPNAEQEKFGENRFSGIVCGFVFHVSQRIRPNTLGEA